MSVANGVKQCWKVDREITGDVLTDSIQAAKDAITLAGFSSVRSTRTEGVILCVDDRTRSNVAMTVIPLPDEFWETTLDELAALLDLQPECRIALLFEALTASDSVPDRCDVAFVCMRIVDDMPRFRIHHIHDISLM